MIPNWMALLLPQRMDSKIHLCSCLVITLLTLRELALEGKEIWLGSGLDVMTNEVTD